MKPLRKILLAALLLFAVQASAQHISGGVIGGISTSSVKITEIPNSLINSIRGNGIMGYEAGLYLKINAGPFYGKPQLLLSHRSGEVSVESEAIPTGSENFKMTRLQIPVMFGFELLGPFAIEAGPVYNRVLDVTESFSNQNISINQNGLGYRIGGVVSVGRLGFSIHYQGLKINSSDSGDSNFELPSELIFGLGLRLGK